MGTRSVHCIKAAGKKSEYHCQYLQFDGYPTGQLDRALRDMKCFFTRVNMDVGHTQLKATKKTVYEFLVNYFNYRQYDTGHSIGNNWKAKKLKSDIDFKNDCWAQWLYLYDPNQYTLTIRCLHTGKSATLNLLNKQEWLNRGFDEYGNQVNEIKLKDYCKKIEEHLSK